MLINPTSLSGFAALSGSQSVTNNKTDAASATSFSNALADVVGNAVAAVKDGETASAQAIAGQANTQDVVERLLEAERTFQAGMAVRDKIVSAYMELSRMTI